MRKLCHGYQKFKKCKSLALPSIRILFSILDLTQKEQEFSMAVDANFENLNPVMFKTSQFDDF